MIKRGRKSQVTLFIIIAILLVGVIVLFFLLRGTIPTNILQPRMPSIQDDIEKCIRDNAKNAIDIMLPQAGYINPNNYKLYENNKVGYLCYTNKFYYPCINQQPIYIEFLEKEIHDYIKPKIEDCFYDLKQKYQEKNYVVSMGSGDYSVNLNPKQVEVVAEKIIEIRKNEEARKYDKFRVKFSNPLYDLAIVAQEIANQEAKFCYFEYLGFSLLYPGIKIEKTNVGSEETASKIYSIKDKISGRELLIAIRSCAMPGGL